MLGDNYLFIDGAYLREVYADLFNPLFGDVYQVDFRQMMTDFNARRAYLYDCPDEEKKGTETDAEFDKRLQQQLDQFDAIERVTGVHVRLGRLTPRKPKKERQQKEVDVLLAVDMLTHAFSGNMDQAILLAGDVDFRPVVESVVRTGTLVKIAYESRSISKDLRKASDSEWEIGRNCIAGCLFVI